MAQVVRTGRAELVENLQACWERCRRAVAGTAADRAGAAGLAGRQRTTVRSPSGGISGRRALNDEYRAFYDLVANHIAQALANAEAYEQERERAEALAQIDRAKTDFFSNVSHEFRTPLTLMLGPLEEMLAMKRELPAAATELVTVTRRNGLRLQKLVNTLLDFSRIEAGRMEAALRRPIWALSRPNWPRHSVRRWRRRGWNCWWNAVRCRNR